MTHANIPLIAVPCEFALVRKKVCMAGSWCEKVFAAGDRLELGELSQEADFARVEVSPATQGEAICRNAAK